MLVKNFPSVVLLPTISVSELNAGNTSRAGFSISLECESGAVSSTSIQQVLRQMLLWALW
jgi:hypothetical protein